MGYEGIDFTWWNNREGEHSISERLDHFLANNAWCQAFPMAKVTHGSAAYSDHAPIMLQTKACIPRRRSHKPFRFEAMWVEGEECGKVIEKAWSFNHGFGHMNDVLQKLKGCSESLAKWNKQNFGLVHKRIQQARDKLAKAQAGNNNTLNKVELQQARDDLQC
ncbi:uncharacterized protein LOC121255039 [Juglans microcarpa x Juglans regia]|uniref:uncharacterized protein LOC121255039 n=1 Tax=Juglans microcarpa x Juglans regia TaxID=2249226 RepID=UPI001B7F445F|nr:uncharacterized protein LOC121255039 [Juglans microcarpa x Juglans regia]